MKTNFLLTRSQLCQTPWTAVACYYALACGISYWLRNVANPTAGLLPIHTIFTYGLGPIIAALATRRLFPIATPKLSLLGSNPVRSLLFVLAPLALGAGFGLANKAGHNPHLYGLLVVLSGLLYGLVEETGWRGFLQPALQPLPQFWQALIVGTLWFGWHFTFLPDTSAIAGPTTPAWAVWGIMVLASWGFGAAMNTTRSILVMAALHEAMNLVNHPVALCLMLLVWVILFRSWKQPLKMPFGQSAFPAESAPQSSN